MLKFFANALNVIVLGLLGTAVVMLLTANVTAAGLLVFPAVFAFWLMILCDTP